MSAAGSAAPVSRPDTAATVDLEASLRTGSPGPQGLDDGFSPPAPGPQPAADAGRDAAVLQPKSLF